MSEVASLTFSEISEILKQHHGPSIAAVVADGLHPHLVLGAEWLATVADFLRTDARLRFNLLRCISAVDWPAKNSIELSYELVSIVLGHTLAVKVMLNRANPQVESVSDVWPAAEWHEREAFDLLGVTFLGHPDLRRILLPEDWVDHPLRKDYPYLIRYKGLELYP